MIECNGSIVRGDTIRWEETVYDGSEHTLYVLDEPIGNRVNTGIVVHDSYGQKKQQHTFVIEIISSEGTEPLKSGTEVRRKGRTLHRFGPIRVVWEDEDMRSLVEAEKRARGAAARHQREIRLKMRENPQFELMFG